MDILIPAGAAVAAFLIVNLCARNPIKGNLNKTIVNKGKDQLVAQIRAAVENPNAYFEASEKVRAQAKQQEALDLYCLEEQTKVRPMISIPEMLTGIPKVAVPEFPKNAATGQMYETPDGRLYAKGRNGWCEIINSKF